MGDKITIYDAIELSGKPKSHIARALGLAEGHFSKIANGHVVPAIDLGFAIAREIGIDAESIIWGHNRPKKAEPRNS